MVEIDSRRSDVLLKFPFGSSKHESCAGEQGEERGAGGRRAGAGACWGERDGDEEGQKERRRQGGGRGERRGAGREGAGGESVPVSEGFAVASCRRMLTAAVEARVRAASCPNPKKLWVYRGSCRFGSFSSCTLSAALVGTSGQKVTCNVAAYGLNKAQGCCSALQLPSCRWPAF